MTKIRSVVAVPARKVGSMFVRLLDTPVALLVVTLGTLVLAIVGMPLWGYANIDFSAALFAGVVLGLVLAVVTISRQHRYFFGSLTALGLTVIVYPLIIVFLTPSFDIIVNGANETPLTTCWLDRVTRNVNVSIDSRALCSQTTIGAGPSVELASFMPLDPQEQARAGIKTEIPFAVRAHYAGNRNVGRVAAVITGDGKQPLIRKQLWDELPSGIHTEQFTLTLQQVVDTSGIVIDRQGEFESSPFWDTTGTLPTSRSGALTVTLVAEENGDQVLDVAAIPVRRAAWDLRSKLTTRNGKKAVDTWLYNQGQTGAFIIYYIISREVGTTPVDNNVMSADMENVEYSVQPAGAFPVTVNSGGYFTHTYLLPDNLAPGRYVAEVYPIKLPPYAAAIDTDRKLWEVNAFPNWWFADPFAFDRHVFNIVVPAADDVVKQEVERAAKEDHVELGSPVSAATTITSPTGIVGYRQVFDNGEVIVYGSYAYSLYGPLLDHYRTWAGPGSVIAQYVGLPLTQMQVITSGDGITGTMMTFEDRDNPNLPAAVYSTPLGAVGIRGGLRAKYVELGSHSGSLGLPTADEQYYMNCVLQRFAHGYLAYPTPRFADGTIDWSHSVVALPAGRARGTADDCPPGDANIVPIWLRLQEQGIDLGFTVAATETITSSTGTVAYRQRFDQGEVVVYGGKAYGLYGEIYQHYKQMVESERWPISGAPLLPVSSIQSVGEGQVLEFEGPNRNFPRVVFYESQRGVAAVFGEILDKYEEEGGPTGWLGFPRADLSYFAYSEAQPFRSGYVVSYYPAASGQVNDYSRPAVALPYVGSQPVLLEVDSRRGWQDTGVWLRSGDVITVEQVGNDLWTHSLTTTPYMAKGTTIAASEEAPPLSSAAMGTLIGKVGVGPTFALGQAASVTSDGDDHLLLAMNDSTRSDNEGFVTVGIQAPPHAIPVDVALFDYQETPLEGKHGWNLAYGERDGVEFAPVDDEFVGLAMRMRGSAPYAIDHELDSQQGRKADTIEAVVLPHEDSAIYANVKLKQTSLSQQCGVASGWLKFRAGEGSQEKYNDGEWLLTLDNGIEMGGGWQRYQVDLIGAVQQTFGQDGCTFDGLLGYRLYGDMDISRIAAYDRQP